MVACELGLAGIRPVVLLVRPDSYMAWTSSQSQISADELRELRSALRQWFGI
jgi:hypothetical protein